MPLTTRWRATVPRSGWWRRPLIVGVARAHRGLMTTIPVSGPPGGPLSASINLKPGPDVLRLAAAAYLGRFKDLSRQHSASDLTVFLTWCAGHGLDPLTAGRADLQRYVRWMQETRRFKPSSVSWRVSVLAGFYRTCVIDATTGPFPGRAPAPTPGCHRSHPPWG
jgi:hypothetical protein